jgi:hypothetical protein
VSDPIEIDLIPTSGSQANVIVSIAQADPDVWTGLAAQANQLAAQAGFDIQTGPLYNSPERTLATIADVQNWLASQSNVGATLAPPSTSSTTSRALVVGLIGVGLLALAAIVSATRPKR